MTAALDPETQRFVDAAIAGAPPLTSDQIVELRRIIKPETRIATASPQPARRTSDQPQKAAA